MRQPFEFDPNDKVKHKFMIQSLKVQPGQDLTTVVSDNFCSFTLGFSLIPVHLMKTLITMFGTSFSGKMLIPDC